MTVVLSLDSQSVGIYGNCYSTSLCFFQTTTTVFCSVLQVNLADCARYSRPTDSFSRGHDSITQVRRARFLTVVGDLLRVCHCHCHIAISLQVSVDFLWQGRRQFQPLEYHSNGVLLLLQFVLPCCSGTPGKRTGCHAAISGQPRRLLGSS